MPVVDGQGCINLDLKDYLLVSLIFDLTFELGVVVVICCVSSTVSLPALWAQDLGSSHRASIVRILMQQKCTIWRDT